MIKGLKGYIRRASHYGSSYDDAFELKVSVSYDAKEFAKRLRKKQNPISASIVDIKNAVRSATKIESMPYVQNSRDWRRAKGGVKTIEVTFHLSKAHAELLGVDIDSWTCYKEIELQSHFEKTKGNLFALSDLENAVNQSSH